MLDNKRKYPEVQLAPDQYDKLATEVTFNGKKILPPDGYLIGQITDTNNGMLVEFVKKNINNIMKDCFIRKNTPELRDKLQELGYYICHCTVVYKDAVWLVTCNKTREPSVHGIGYGEENIQSALDLFLYENEKSENPLIDCGEDEEMFLKIAKENLL